MTVKALPTPSSPLHSTPLKSRATLKHLSRGSAINGVSVLIGVRTESTVIECIVMSSFIETAERISFP